MFIFNFTHGSDSPIKSLSFKFLQEIWRSISSVGSPWADAYDIGDLYYCI